MDRQEKKNHYQVLGIPKEATADEIKSAYRKRAKELHPDISGDIQRKTRFLHIQEAYETLSKPESRDLYDAELDIFTKPPANITIINSNNVNQNVKEEQKHYSFLRISPSKKNVNHQSDPINLTILLDISSSMRGGRIYLAKKNIRKLFNHLEKNDKFSLIIFNDRATHTIQSNFVGNIKNIVNELDMIRTEGGTEIFQGLSKGLEDFDTNNSNNNYLILLTDGHTYGDEQKCKNILKNAAGKNILFDVFGFGSKWNEIFLEDLVNETGGRAIFVKTESILEHQFLERIKRRNDLVANSLSLNLEWNNDITLSYVFKNRPDFRKLPQNKTIKLGNLYIDDHIEIIFEQLIKPNEKYSSFQSLGSGFIDMFVPNTQSIVREMINIYPKNNEKMMSPEEERYLILCIRNLTFYRMQEEVKSDLTNGNYLQASKRLKYLTTQNFSKQNKKIIAELEREAEFINKHKRFSKYGDKNITHGTRLLLSSPKTGRLNDN